MGVTKALSMAVKSNAANGRNLGDTVPQKFWRWFWFSVYLCRAIGTGLRFTRCEQLGSRVLYQGESAVVSNWAGGEVVSLCVGNKYIEHARRKDIQQRVNVSELLHRFRYGFSFYTTNWMQSQINDRVCRLGDA